MVTIRSRKGSKAKDGQVLLPTPSPIPVPSPPSPADPNPKSGKKIVSGKGEPLSNNFHYSDKVSFVTDKRFDGLTWEHWKKDLKGFLGPYEDKYGKERLKTLRFTIKMLHKTGEREKYLMSAKMLTDRGDYYADKEGWDANIVFHDLLEALRKQVWR